MQFRRMLPAQAGSSSVAVVALWAMVSVSAWGGGQALSGPASGSKTSAPDVPTTQSPSLTVHAYGERLVGPRPSAVTTARQVSSYLHLPLSFAPNYGQDDPRVRFTAHGRGYGLSLANGEALFSLERPSARVAPAFTPVEAEAAPTFRPAGAGLKPGAITDDVAGGTSGVLSIKLVGANPGAAVAGAQELPGRANYFIGNNPQKWHTDVPTYARVVYHNVYPGVDLIYYGNQSGQLEYDFLVAPGADPGAIAMAVGSTRESRGGPLRIATNGDVIIPAPGGELRFQKPLVYQEPSSARYQASEVHGESYGAGSDSRPSANRQFLEGQFTLDAQNQIHFKIGPYDHTRPLIIDPVAALTVDYSSFIPFPIATGSGGLAVDSGGDVYLFGTASSSTLPVQNPLPPPNNALHGTSNLFIAELNAAGDALVMSTYLGGSGTDSGGHIALDSSNNIYVTGSTTSTDFPITTGAYQSALPGTRSAFVTELNAAGNAIVYSTYLGGSGQDGASGIAVGAPGSVYVTGGAASSDFPTTAGVLQPTLKGDENVFVAEINTARAGASSLVFSTYLGGSGYDSGDGIGVDASGDVTVGGITGSNNFPTLNPYQSSRGEGEITMFVAKLNSTGSALVYSTYLGGNYNYFNGYTQYAYNEFGGLAVDSSGNAYIGGNTDAYDFPIHLGYQSSFPDNTCTWDGFVAKFNPAGTNIYSSFFGGTQYQGSGVTYCGDVSGIAVDASGDAYVTGFTEAGDFPLMNPLEAIQGGGITPTFAVSAFVSELSAGGSSAPTLKFSTYLGGTYQEEGYSIALDSLSSIYVAGLSYSSDFPVTAGSYSTTSGQGYFLAKISDLATPALAVTPQTVTFPAQAIGARSSARTVLVHDLSGNAMTVSSISIGGSNPTDFAETNTCSSALSGGTDCSVSVTFTPSFLGPETATLTVASTGAIGSPATITLNGTGASDGIATSAPASTVYFGYQLLGTSAQQTVTLTNTGTGPLGSIAVSLSPGPPDFTQTNNCPASLAVNASCSIIVTYTANVSGYDSGTLTITNDSPTSPQTLFVYGYGAVPLAQLSSSSWNYGFWAVGTTSSIQNFFVLNNGGVPLTVNGIVLSGPNAGDFIITANSCGSSVAGSSDCGITIHFIPSVYGPESATLTITDNSNNVAGSTQTVALSGTGVHVAQLSAAALSFGNQTVNTASGPRTETLTNFGSTALSITSIAASGPFTQTNTCGASLAARATCNIVVTFTPTTLGPASGALTVTYTGPGSPETVVLSGNSISAPLTSCPTSFLQASTNYGHLPLTFEANAGQTDPQVKFLSRGWGYGLFLTGDEAVLELQKPENRPGSLVADRLSSGKDGVSGAQNEGQMTRNALVRMKVIGANPHASVSGLDELRGKSNYFVGSNPSEWVKQAATYAKVRYEQVYPGIDLIYYGNQRGQLEYDFVVAPGASPGAILLDVGTASAVREQATAHGDAPLRITPDGDLVVTIDGGELLFHKPVVYQEAIGAQIAAAGVEGDDRNSIANVPRSDNLQSAIANRQYVTGRFVLSAENHISFEVGPYDHTKRLVIDPDLNYATYLGGSGVDYAVGIAVDASCSAYISGQVTSVDFPVSANAPEAAHSANSVNAFVTKLSPDGTAIVYSTYLGGSSDDEGRLIAVDTAGNAYVTGRAGSSNFPVTSSAFQSSLAGQRNAFLSKISPDGSTLLYSTYLGVYIDEAFGIAADSAGNAYITGESMNANNSCDGDCPFPTTSNAYQTTWSGTQNAFVAKFNTTASGAASLVYATLLGGSGSDRGYGITIDSSGDAYVTGGTTSSDFPTANAYQSSFSGGGAACGSGGTRAPVCGDAFVTVLDPGGHNVLYSTYLGGSGEDGGVGITLDPSGKTYVTGGSDSSDFPTTNGAFQTSFTSSTTGCATSGVGCGNAFVAKLDTTQSGAPSLLYSTYLGGENDDIGGGIAADAQGFAFVAGVTNSTQFPTVSPIYPFGGGTIPCQTSNLACGDAFVAKLNPTGTGLVFSTYLGGSQDDGAFTLAVDALGNAYVAGPTASTNFPVTPGAFQTTYGGGITNAFVARIGYIEFPILTPAPTSLTFAPQNFGTTSSAQTLTVTNTGDAALTVTAIGFAAGTQGFAQTNNCPVSPSTLAVGGSCQFNVTYSPTQPGSQSDLLIITDNEASGQTSITLSGTGNGQANFSTTTLNFPAQALNTTSAAQAVTITNGGASALTVSAITITGANSGDFAQTNSCGASVPVSGSCSIMVTFSPTAGGTFSASLSVTYNSGGGPSTQLVSLAGSGVAPPSITKAFGSGTVALNGTTSLTFTIANPAANTAGLAGVGFTDSLPAGVVVATPNGLAGTCAAPTVSATSGSGAVSLTGYALAPGQSCTITVNVTGTTVGAKNNSVTITSTNGGAGNTSLATLTVIGPPSVTESFGASTIGVSGVTSLTYVVNNPNASLAVNGIGFADSLPAGVVVATPNGVTGTCGGGAITATAGSSTVSLTGATLAASASCTFSINVAGASVTNGPVTNSVTVSSSNAGAGNTATASLTVVLASGVLSTSALSFGNQGIGIPNGSQPVTFQNVSSSALTITSISVTGANPGDFSFGGTCGAALAAGATCQITVAFDPTAAGNRSGVLQVVYGAAGSPQTVSLTGTGVAPTALASVSTLSFQHNLNLTCPSNPVIIQNTGSVAMAIQGIATTGAFSQTNTCGAVLAAGASCEVDVSFTAEAPVNTYSGSLTVNDTAQGGPQVIPLSGQVFPPCALASAQGSTQQFVRGATSATFNLSDGAPSCHTAVITMACANNQPATCVFNPPTISPGGSTVLNVQNLNAVTTDNFSFTATATDVNNTTSVNLLVLLGDFAFTPYPTTATVSAGQTATYAMTLSPVNGLAGTIQLACQGAPANSTCTVTPAAVTLANNYPAQISVAVSTGSRAFLAPRGGKPQAPIGLLRLWIEFALLLILLSLAISVARRSAGLQPGILGYRPTPRRLALSGVILAALTLMLMAWAACGGGGGMNTSPALNSGTPAGTYSLTVTGAYSTASGQATSLKESQAVTLQVN